jgi:hypothetical protein
LNHSDNMAILQHHNAVGHLVCAGHVVRDDHTGHVKVALQPQDQLVDNVSAYGIQPRSRLVVQHHFGIQGDGPGQGDTLSLAPGELRGPARLQPVQTDEVQFFRDDPGGLFLRVLAVLRQRKADILGNGHGVEQRALLEENAEPPPHGHQPWFGEIVDALAVEIDSAAVRAKQHDDVLEQHALAGAGLTDDHGGPPPLQGQINALEHLQLAEALTHAAELDDGAVLCFAATHARSLQQ